MIYLESLSDDFLVFLASLSFDTSERFEDKDCSSWFSSDTVFPCSWAFFFSTYAFLVDFTVFTIDFLAKVLDFLMTLL